MGIAAKQKIPVKVDLTTSVLLTEVCRCSYHNSSCQSLSKYMQRQTNKRIANNINQYQSSVVVR